MHLDGIARSGARYLLPALALGAAALLARPAATPAATTRVAIRIACDDASGACALAEDRSVDGPGSPMAGIAADGRCGVIDVWTEDRVPGEPLDVVVPPCALARLAAAGVRFTVLVPDIDAVAAEEHARLTAPSAQDDGGDWFADYRDYRAITKRLEDDAALAPALATMHAIGSSLEGRPIWALQIGGGAPDATPMLLDGTQHAREWIAAMTTTCVADRLVRGYATDPVIHDFVDHTRLWVVPVANPDGYQFSWSTDRYWRKNRRDGRGVDLNRNFAVAFGGPGSSSNERAETYRGPYAFSEPESAALRDLAKRERIALHVDFHAYSQLLLYPWNYTATPAADRARFAGIGDKMASAMFAQHQTSYRLMSGVELYAAAGTMSDWMYGAVGALSYTIELRPKDGRGRFGFVLPPSEIKPTCDEGLAAVLALRANAGR